MNTGLKVWLWIVFVINIISGVMMIPLMLIQPLLIVSLIAEVLIIVGAGLCTEEGWILSDDCMCSNRSGNQHLWRGWSGKKYHQRSIVPINYIFVHEKRLGYFPVRNERPSTEPAIGSFSGMIGNEETFRQKCREVFFTLQEIAFL